MEPRMKMSMCIFNQQHLREISISFVWSRPKSHFQTEHVQWSDGGQREALITVEIVFIIGVKADDTKQEEKFAIHEIQQLFSSFASLAFRFLSSTIPEEIPFPLWAEEHI